VTLTRCNDGCLSVVNFARSTANSLESLDDVQGSLISNLAEDDVLAIEPAGDNSGDEELGTVGVRTGIGH